MPCCSESFLGAEEKRLPLQLGLYLILFPSLGGMLLPALIIVPAHIIRYPFICAWELFCLAIVYCPSSTTARDTLLNLELQSC